MEHTPRARPVAVTYRQRAAGAALSTFAALAEAALPPAQSADLIRTHAQQAAHDPRVAANPSAPPHREPT